MNKYLIGIVIALGISLGAVINSSIKQKHRANRMTEQYQKSLNDNKSLELTYKELNSDQRDRIKELSDSLDIKPKKIKEYVNIYITDTIIDTVFAEVTRVDSNTYAFAKDTACFMVKGLVHITPIAPIIQITELQYSNTIEYIVYLNRREWKFLFVRSKFLGKKYVDIDVIQECGTAKVEDVKLIKR